MSEETVKFIVILLCILCASIISVDAHRRGMNWPLWGLLSFLFSLVALPIYLIVRKPLPSAHHKTLESTSGSDADTSDAAPKGRRPKH